MISQTVQQENLRHWVGADVAKKTFTASLARRGQRWGLTALGELPRKTFVRNPQGVEQLVAWLCLLLELPPAQLDIGVVMETTGKYSTELAAWMTAQHRGLCPAIVHARQASAFIQSLHVRGKTDDIEARALAFYGVERRPAPYQALPARQLELRELVRHRAQLLELKLALQNRQGEGSQNTAVCQSQERMLKQFTQEIARIELKMRKCVDRSAELGRDEALLRSIHGVAFLTATLILAELGDLRRFERARQLSAFAGLSPRPLQSGSSIDKPAHLCKQGSGSVRKALYMAALTAIHDSGPMQATFEKACAAGKPKMVALGAVMRKLLVLMRAILISGKPYDPQWKKRPQPVEKEA